MLTHGKKKIVELVDVNSQASSNSIKFNLITLFTSGSHYIHGCCRMMSNSRVSPSCSALCCAALHKRFRRARSRAVSRSKIIVCGFLATAGLNNYKHGGGTKRKITRAFLLPSTCLCRIHKLTVTCKSCFMQEGFDFSNPAVISLSCQ